MKALLVVAHGSRRRQSNDEVLSLAIKLKAHCVDHYASVHAAFLELAAPSIPEGITQCVEDGATTIVVLPYFLNSGRHVVEDIPRIVNDTKIHYPNIDIRIAPHLSASEQMLGLMIASANSVA